MKDGVNINRSVLLLRLRNVVVMLYICCSFHVAHAVWNTNNIKTSRTINSGAKNINGNHHRIKTMNGLLLSNVNAKKDDDSHNSHSDTATTNGTSIPFIDSRVSVQIPFELHHPDGFEHVKANFGFTKSRGSIYGYVYYIEGGHLCDPISSLSAIIMNKSDTGNPWKVYPNDIGSKTTTVFQSPFILMTQLSDLCSGVIQVRNGQAIGSSGMIIGEQHCRCNDNTCITKFGSDHCSNMKVSTLYNDGSAGDITIPSFLLYHYQAWEMIDQMKTKNQDILIELAWGLKPKIHDVANNLILHEPLQYSLYTTPYDPMMNHNMLYEMKLLSSLLTYEQAQFHPHYYILDGNRFNCVQTENVNHTGPCDHLCTNHGRYCTAHAKDLSGYAILRETLRQICIWNHYGSYNADMKGLNEDEKLHHDMYWDYVIYHRTHCSHPDQFANIDCIYDSYNYAKIPIDVHNKTSPIIDQCIHDSGNIDDDVINTAFDYHMKKQQEHGIVTIPSIVLNNQILEDSSNVEHLFNGICEHYWTTPLHDDTLYPEICDTCGSCPYLAGCLEHKKCIVYPNHRQYEHDEYDREHEEEEQMNKNKKSQGSGGRGRHHSWFWSFFLFIMVCGGGLLYAYYKHNNDTLPFIQHTRQRFGGNNTNNQDRAGLLNNYFQLSSTE